MKDLIMKLGKKYNLLQSLIILPIIKTIQTIVFLSFVLLVLFVVLKPLGLYVSIRDTLIEFGNFTHVVIKKENKLLLEMGYPNTQGHQEDNYIVNLQGMDIAEKFYFVIINPEREEVYNSVRLFIVFLDEDTKVNIEGSKEPGGWTMFQSNNFNYGPIQEILQTVRMPTSPIFFKFPEKKTYKLFYVLYADGYKPKKGFKNIIVQ